MNEQERDSLATLASDVLDKAVKLHPNREMSEYLISVYEKMWGIIRGKPLKSSA